MDIILCVYEIPRKARDGLAQDDIDLPVSGCLDHPHEFRTFFRRRARDAPIREYARKLPVWVLPDECFVIVLLGLVALLLLLQQRTDTRIRGDLFLFFFDSYRVDSQ